MESCSCSETGTEHVFDNNKSADQALFHFPETPKMFNDPKDPVTVPVQLHKCRNAG